MQPQELIEFIQQIPEYIRYVYPGGITIYLYMFFRGYSMKESRGIIVKAIALSYLYNIFIENIIQIYPEAQVKFNGVLICFSVVVAYICYQLIESELFAVFLDEFDIKTSTKADELNLIDSDQKYTYLRVYLKEKNIAYEGFLKNYETEDVKNKFIILSQYKVIYWSEAEPVDKNIMIDKDFDSDDHEWVIIYYNNIDRIEKRNIKKVL